MFLELSQLPLFVYPRCALAIDFVQFRFYSLFFLCAFSSSCIRSQQTYANTPRCSVVIVVDSLLTLLLFSVSNAINFSPFTHIYFECC